MDAALKYKLVEKIIQSDDDVVLNRVKTILEIKDTDFWSELPKELKAEIRSAKAELDNDLGIPHAQVSAEITDFLK